MLEKQYYEDHLDDEVYVLQDGKIVKVEVNDEDDSVND